MGAQAVKVSEAYRERFECTIAEYREMIYRRCVRELNQYKNNKKKYEKMRPVLNDKNLRLTRKLNEWDDQFYRIFYW